MNLLAIDTSTKNFSIAVSCDEKVLAYKNVKLDKILSSSIIPGIQVILKKAKLTRADIDGFAIGLGPGSFTSLRVGLSTIKGLAFAMQKPVVGVPSLDLLAAGLGADHPQIVVIMDAKRNLVYSCLYSLKNNQLKRQSDYRLSPIGDILKEIKGEAFFVGDGIGLFKQDIERCRHLKGIFAEEKWWVPQARWIVPIALERFKKKNFDKVADLLPLYLYPEDCQVRA